MTTALIPSPVQDLAAMAVSVLPSPHSQRVYAGALRAYFARGQPLTREGVAAWLGELRAAKKSPQTVNVALYAAKLLAHEAEVRGLISPSESMAIRDLQGDPVLGVRTGNWLPIQVVRRLIARMDRSTLQAKRDAALFALLLGCGLRRAEACNAQWSHYQKREGRMCLVNLRGKGRRVRTIPVPSWAAEALDDWRQACQRDDSHALDDSGAILRGFPVVGGREGRAAAPKLSEEAVRWIVKQYLPGIAPHDLRRTLAKLMYDAGAHLEQIQLFLGHSNPATTMKYIGTAQDMAPGKAACDLVAFVETEEKSCIPA